MAKSRVPPTKIVFIPRFELAAAVLSIKFSTMLRRELTIHPTIKEYIWTDSGMYWVMLTMMQNFLRSLWQIQYGLSRRIQMLVSGCMLNPSLEDYTSHGISY